jgi:PncC family amidohydrolase
MEKTAGGTKTRKPRATRKPRSASGKKGGNFEVIDVIQRRNGLKTYFDLVRPEDILNDVKAKAHAAGYRFLNKLILNNSKHQIATAESLTGGLIFSTLIDIPFGGTNKYGCFSVYDTDAKRIFLGVRVKELYSHKCVKEMAEGILKNSNASFAIAVSGNAMTDQSGSPEQINQLGEVYIGVATYNTDNRIICETKVFNMCSDKSSTAPNICKYWIDTAMQPGVFNNYIITSLVSNYIRNKTAELAFNMASNFIDKNGTSIGYPNILRNNRKTENDSEIRANNGSNNILLKDTRSALQTICINTEECEYENREDHPRMKKLFDYNQRSSSARIPRARSMMR